MSNAQLVTPQNIAKMLKQTSHKDQSKDKLKYIENDVKAFLQRNQACQCSIVDVKFNTAEKMQQVLQIRGKLKINLPQSGSGKLLGFKFILPKMYPIEAPLVYLDEPENPQVIDMIDYLDKGNRIVFEYILVWEK